MAKTAHITLSIDLNAQGAKDVQGELQKVDKQINKINQDAKQFDINLPKGKKTPSSTAISPEDIPIVKGRMKGYLQAYQNIASQYLVDLEKIIAPYRNRKLNANDISSLGDKLSEKALQGFYANDRGLRPFASQVRGYYRFLESQFNQGVPVLDEEILKGLADFDTKERALRSGFNAARTLRNQVEQRNKRLNDANRIGTSIDEAVFTNYLGATSDIVNSITNGKDGRYTSEDLSKRWRAAKLEGYFKGATKLNLRETTEREKIARFTSNIENQYKTRQKGLTHGSDELIGLQRNIASSLKLELERQESVYSELEKIYKPLSRTRRKYNSKELRGVSLNDLTQLRAAIDYTRSLYNAFSDTTNKAEYDRLKRQAQSGEELDTSASTANMLRASLIRPNEEKQEIKKEASRAAKKKALTDTAFWYALGDASRSLSRTLWDMPLEQAKGSFDEYLKFEGSMMGVVKQLKELRDPKTGLINNNYRSLRNQVLGMTETLPLSGADIADSIARASRMGVEGRTNLLKNVETSSKLSIGFDMPAEEIMSHLAKIAAASGMSPSDVDGILDIGDAVNYLDDHTNATGVEILSFLKDTAAIGNTMGISAKKIAAIGTAMISQGTEWDVARTAVKNLLLISATGARNQKKGQQYVSYMGMSDKEMMQRMKNDPISGMLYVLKKLNDAKNNPAGRDTNAIIRQVFGKESLLAISKLVNDVPYLEKVLKMVDKDSSGWTEQEYQARIKNDPNTQMKLLENQIQNLRIEMGGALYPALKEIMPDIKNAAQSFGDVAKDNPKLISNLTKGILTAGAMAKATGVLADSAIVYTTLSQTETALQISKWMRGSTMASGLGGMFGLSKFHRASGLQTILGASLAGTAGWALGSWINNMTFEKVREKNRKQANKAEKESSQARLNRVYDIEGESRHLSSLQKELNDLTTGQTPYEASHDIPHQLTAKEESRRKALEEEIRYSKARIEGAKARANVVDLNSMQYASEGTIKKANEYNSIAQGLIQQRFSWESALTQWQDTAKSNPVYAQSNEGQSSLESIRSHLKETKDLYDNLKVTAGDFSQKAREESLNNLAQITSFMDAHKSTGDAMKDFQKEIDNFKSVGVAAFDAVGGLNGGGIKGFRTDTDHCIEKIDTLQKRLKELTAQEHNIKIGIQTSLGSNFLNLPPIFGVNGKNANGDKRGASLYAPVIPKPRMTGSKGMMDLSYNPYSESGSNTYNSNTWNINNYGSQSVSDTYFQARELSSMFGGGSNSYYS